VSNDVQMAWRNVWRNPRRTVLTASAVAFACLLLVFMLSFQFGSYEAMINTAVKVHTGHLQVQAKGYREDHDMRHSVNRPNAVRRIADNVAGVRSITFRANAFSLVSSKERTHGAMVIGIDPEREARTSRLRRLIRQGVYLSGEDRPEALVGALLAGNLRIEIGDELTLLGQGRDGSIAATVVTVVGIYRTGQDDFDRSSVQIPLPLFQQVFSMGDAVHEVVLLADALDRVPAIRRRITEELERSPDTRNLVVLDWKRLMPGLSQGITMDLVSGIIMYFILILVVAFSILNTFLMAIFERTKEFGVMMAIGTTPDRLTILLLAESGMVTALGIAVGTAVGAAVTLYFQYHGIDLAGASEILQAYGISGRLYPKLSVASCTAGPAAVLVVTFFAAVYPALKVRRLRPVEAMTAV
jgi:putative ABC transport system permease protein